MTEKYRSLIRRIGPYSKPKAYRYIDGRRSEARIMNHIKQALVAHCGGKPSVAEDIIIRMVVIDLVRLRLLSGRMLDEDVGDRDIKLYDRLQHSIRRHLKTLGIRGREQAPEDLRAYMETRK